MLNSCGGDGARKGFMNHHLDKGTFSYALLFLFRSFCDPNNEFFLITTVSPLKCSSPLHLLNFGGSSHMRSTITTSLTALFVRWKFFLEIRELIKTTCTFLFVMIYLRLIPAFLEAALLIKIVAFTGLTYKLHNTSSAASLYSLACVKL
jgi:hypothetical protein